MSNKRIYTKSHIGRWSMKDMRYAKYAIVAVIFASLVSIAPNFAYSQAGQLTVKVDKASYGEGETVRVSGTVPAVLEGVPVAIQVFNARNTMYNIGQVTPNADGTYSWSFNVGGRLAGPAGFHTVKVTYSGQSVQAQFEFTGGAAPAEGFPFEYDRNRFVIKNTLTNGEITKIEVDEEFTSIIITVRTSATDDGTLDITLPRPLIDARLDGCEGDDDIFIVLVNGEDTDFEETGMTTAERSLRIPVPAGTEDIEIIGTCVIPEFGVIAALVLAAAVGAIVVVSRKNQILKVLPR
jgi:predicted secreted protein with PEFG-CTERM motif